MNNIEHTVRSRFPDLVLLGCVLGFMGILIELYSIEHFQRGSQIIGFLSTIAGLIVSALGFVPSLRKVVVPLLALLTLTGLYGTLEHRETRQGDYAEWQQRQAAAKTSGTTATTAAGEDGPRGAANRPFRSNIPLLAPMALSGLSALSLMSVLARRRPNELVDTYPTQTVVGR